MKNRTAKTVKELVDVNAHLPDKDFCIWKYKKEIRRVTYSQMRDEVYRIAEYVQSIAKQKGKQVKVGILGPNSYQYIAFSLGAMIGGNVMATIDINVSPEEIARRLNYIDADIVVCDKKLENYIENLREMCPQTEKWIIMNGEASLGINAVSYETVISGFSGRIEGEPSPEDFCAIMFTSGTTGRSKAVMLSHKNLAHEATATDEKLGSDAINLSVLPLYHSFGYSLDVLMILSWHATIAINDSPMHLIKNIKDLNIRTLMVVPMIALSIYKTIVMTAKKNPDVPKQTVAETMFGKELRCLAVGGARLDPAVMKNLREYGISVSYGYGITECSPRIATDFLEKNTRDLDRTDCGYLMEGFEFKTVEDEIWVRGDSVMMGYYNNEEATHAALTEDGWFRTGDLGYLDDNNCVHISGRKKNLIILSNGENVSPEEIEFEYSIEPFVKEVIVYEDEDNICAEVFPDEDFVRKNNITNTLEFLRELGKEINKRLISYQQVTKFRVREVEFPKTPTMKIIRERKNR